jgi:hypothetical protein
VDSLPDLLANKLYALIERRYELDRTDIYAMLQRMEGVTIAGAVDGAEAKFDLRGQVQDAVLRRLGATLPDESPAALFEAIDLDAMAAFFHERGAPLAARG